MTEVRDENGRLLFHEPPYTLEEELKYITMANGQGPVTVLHGASPPVQRQTAQQPPAKK